MKFKTQSPLHVLLLSLILIFQFSCSKDSDLLTDYVLADAKQDLVIGKFVVDDTFETAIDNPIVLDVLANDAFENTEEVVVTETTTPANGTVEINTDNTITYTPETTEATVDTFTYTTEVIVDETVSTETGTVTIAVEDANKTGELKAFPGAEGYGKKATGGRGKSVYEVTNLNDSGAGSFRKAVDDADANNGGTIVFKTGGTVNLLSSIIIGSNGGQNITIAGETAPGDGFGVRMSSTPTYGAAIEIRGSNIIIRHIRIHVGSSAHSSCDGLRIHNQWDTNGATLENVIADHLSVYWTTDEAIEIGSYHGGTVRNITIQNTLVAEPLGEGYGPLIYRDIKNGSVNNNVSFYANMFNDIKDRSPSGTVSGLNYEVINSIKYNVYNNTLVTYGNKVDYIGNIIKSSAIQPDLPYQKNVFNYDPNNFSESGLDPALGAIWENDNLIIDDLTGNPRNNAAWTTNNNGSRVNTDSGLTPMSSSLVSSFVTSNVGSNLHKGTIVNDHDTRVINNYINGTGAHITSENQVGGHLTYATGTAWIDTDKDGISDAYETLRGWSTTVANNNVVTHVLGYTQLEEFLHYKAAGN